MVLKTRPIYQLSPVLYWIIGLGLISLLLENSSIGSLKIIILLTHLLDDAIVLIFTISTIINFTHSRYKMLFVRRKSIDFIFLILSIATIIYLIYHKYYALLIGQYTMPFILSKIILGISVITLLQEIKRIRNISYAFEIFAAHPAETIIIAFLSIIFTGTVLLMMPFATTDNSRLGFVNALFTATSATCVTGLTVIDISTKLSLIGQIVLLCLIQIGGLGVMLFSFFTAFFMGKRMSLPEKITLSYLLNENDIKNVAATVRKIIIITFSIELLGAVLLSFQFKNLFGYTGQTLFFSIFHAISAFCNAGFALFSNNLEQFKSSTLVVTTIASLIILGGISFAVINNILEYAKSKAQAFRRRGQQPKLTINTKLVLTITFILIVSGTLLIYNFEHKTTLLPYDIKTQYLSSFFQSVTLRTAGFNTLNLSQLQLPTYLMMILLMFIGGAAGSTAGGIKVNTVGVVYASLTSALRNRNEVVLRKHAISKKTVSNAFVLLILGSIVVFLGTCILAICEREELTKILFEVTSAFGTVGLSTGITPSLTLLGKLIISSIMFIGRIGPLTLITALAYKKRPIAIRYPEEDVLIG